MKNKRLSRLLVAMLVLAMCVWTLSACGNKGTSEEPTDEDNGNLYTASEVDSELPMADAVQSYVDKVDVDYGYKMAEKLAYDEDLGDHLLWRTAGSDSEHKCAEYLAKEMDKIGLQDVEKVSTPCDKFQLNGSSLTIKGTDIDLEPAAYQMDGTDGDLTAEIVNVKHGYEAEYEGKDVKGKIVLAQVDQANEAWIDGYIRQAYEEGAAALVTWANSGYGEANKDTINVQDVCCDNLLPTAAISANQAKEVKAAIKAGNNECTLNLDVDFEDGGGTTENVMGVIPGENHDQKIVVSAHYDKYWYGFQDDCAAVALVYTVAKAMIDSGYVPENDIVFIAHGAEEWGTSDSQFDWTTGAWGMIDQAHPEWSGKILSMINCELPAYKTDSGNLSISSVPEYQALGLKLINDSGLVVTSGDIALKSDAIDPTTTMEDGVSYRWHGVPYFLNHFEGEAFTSNNYHTQEDNKGTYDEDTFLTNINWYGAFAMYIDQEPAIELDMTASVKNLKENFNADNADKAGVDVAEYKAQLKEMNKVAKAQNDAIAKCNDAYNKAVADDDADAMAAARTEGAELNQKSLAMFKSIQDSFLKDNDFDIYYGHKGIDDNIMYLQGAVDGIENNNLMWNDAGDSVCDMIYNVNAVHDYGYYRFSVDVANTICQMYNGDNLQKQRDQWGYQKQIPVVDVGQTTYDIYKAIESEDKDYDYEAAKATYEAAVDECIAQIGEYSNDEIAQMKAFVELYK